MKKQKKDRATKWDASMFQTGDVVFDLDKEPDPGTNKGIVCDVLIDQQLVRVTWKDGTTSERPPRKLGKVGPMTSSYTPDPSKRKELWDRILQMTDEEMDAEIARLDRLLNLN